MTNSLKTLQETPVRRIHEVGAAYASNLELLGALIGNPDTALDILNRYPALSDLARAGLSDLLSIHGLGEAKVAQIKASFELGRRLALAAPQEKLRIRSPQDAANCLMGEMRLLEQEELRVMLLDTRNQVLNVETVYKGSLNTSVIRTAEIFREAIRRNAAAIIVAHNHPSGDPSPEDVAVTRNIIATGKMLDIECLDHMVIGDNRFVSLKERGLAFG